MENEKLNRINELVRIAKERELTSEELSERDALRKEYIAEWRRGAEQVLENTYIVYRRAGRKEKKTGAKAASYILTANKTKSPAERT